MFVAVTEEDSSGRPLLETREFCRSEDPTILEVLPGLTRRADGPPRKFEVPSVVVMVVDIKVWW